MKMRKLCLFIALALIISIGGVYATWTYTQSTDVADIRQAAAINMTDAAFIGTYGTYNIDTSTLQMVIDPKENTTHTTALYITGEIVITFTPNVNAPSEVKTNGVPSTYTFSLSNADWTYLEEDIMSIDTSVHNIVWTPGAGVFTCTIDAATLASYITLTEFELDTKAEYDAYDTVLENGQISISVSDGITSTP